MTAPSLIVWLRAALDEDERRARKLHASICGHDNVAMDAACDCDWHVGFRLAEVQSKRTLIDIILQHAAKIDGEWGCCHEPESIALGHCPETSVDEIPGLRALAQPYRSRPGFREEWL